MLDGKTAAILKVRSWGMQKYAGMKFGRQERNADIGNAGNAANAESAGNCFRRRNATTNLNQG